MGYLKNKQINLLNLHTGLYRFANSIFYIFGTVYFLKQGIPLHIALLIWSFTFIIRMTIRPFALILQETIGLKKSVILGTLFFPGVFIFLSQINGINIWFFLFPIYFAIADSLYWLPYHAYYAAMGDLEHRGKHIGTREALITVLTSIAPVLNGFLIKNIGFWLVYIIAPIVMISAILPLLFANDCSPGEKMTYKKAFKKIDRKGFWLLLGDSIAYNANQFLWPIVLFLLFGNFVILGGLMSLEMFLVAILFLLLGHFIDNGKGIKIVWSAFILFIIVVLGRSFYVNDIKSILIFEVIAALMLCTYSSSLNTAFYNLAKKSHNTLWFHYFAEFGWDIGAFISLTLASLWVYLGFELRYIMPLSLVGILIVRGVLRNYFISAKKEYN